MSAPARETGRLGEDDHADKRRERRHRTPVQAGRERIRDQTPDRVKGAAS